MREPLPAVNRREAIDAAIWKVDRFATHDGPGIRTNLYFKGCPLRCLWCSNPEGQRVEEDFAFSIAKCTGCGECFPACPVGALRPESGRAGIDFERCTRCGDCVPACPPGALHLYEGSYSLVQVMDIVRRDRHIYRRSGGGITCTGGEPFKHPEFLMELLSECRDQGIHTCVESSGCADPVQFRGALPLVDWLFLDLKHMDKVRHRRLTGKDNTLILDNLRTASSFFADTGKVLVIRQVVVPGFNDGENIRALAELASRLPRVDFVELLPYHAYGEHKYQGLGRDYTVVNIETPVQEELNGHKSLVESYGVECRIGTN